MNIDLCMPARCAPLRRVLPHANMIHDSCARGRKMLRRRRVITRVTMLRVTHDAMPTIDMREVPRASIQYYW